MAGVSLRPQRVRPAPNPIRFESPRGGSARQNRVRARNVTPNRWNRWRIQVVFISPLVALQEAFSSSALAQVNRPGMDVAQGEREQNRLVLLMLDGTTFCLWRTSIRPLLRQTMTYPYEEPTNPSGSATSPMRHVKNRPKTKTPESDTLPTSATVS